MKIHLDTDIGGDPDDLCALAMVLGWPDAELVAVTTVAEHNGKRAGYVRHALRLAEHNQIAVAAGADAELGCFEPFPMLPPEERYWRAEIAPHPAPHNAALDLLERSIELAATIVAIGPYSNLALLEQRTPGILRDARLFLMGGYVFPPPPGFPHYAVHEDYNIQADAAAADVVFKNSDPTLVPLAVTTQTALRRSDLPVLRNAGPLAQLIAHQAEMFAEDDRYEEKYGLINIHHDPLACAIALGWSEGVTIETLTIKSKLVAGRMQQTIASDGRPAPIVTSVDGEAFNRIWLEAVTR